MSFAGKTHLLLLFVVVLASGTLLGCGKKSTNHFAIKVAKAKLWNEASFRWQQVTEEIPDAAFAIDRDEELKGLNNNNNNNKIGG